MPEDGDKKEIIEVLECKLRIVIYQRPYSKWDLENHVALFNEMNGQCMHIEILVVEKKQA